MRFASATAIMIYLSSALLRVQSLTCNRPKAGCLSSLTRKKHRTHHSLSPSFIDGHSDAAINNALKTRINDLVNHPAVVIYISSSTIWYHYTHVPHSFITQAILLICLMQYKREEHSIFHCRFCALLPSLPLKSARARFANPPLPPLRQ
jgi:hypothetical protein